MSRAFISEDAAAAAAAERPERPITPGPNPVTAEGLALIDAELARLQAVQDSTPPDDPARAATARDLRYWRARRASASLVPVPDARPEDAAFGTRVTLRRGDGTEITYRIVGEDEADPARFLLSWLSPLAEALLGARPGDIIDIGGGRPPVTIVKLESK